MAVNLGERRQRLERFRLAGVEETGVEIGRGSYAAVVELRFRGLKCAGKKLYPHLYGGVGMLQRFEEECDLLGQTRHPNIVQFLGVTFEDGTQLPTIVMEFMHATLASCLDRYGVLPQEVSYTILDDVATALCYLHGNDPRIIHRDLSANNVLLTSDMRAKISDLGVAKILNYTPARMTQMTTCPGTPAYMPPESLDHNPTYSTDIDSFSYGVTMVHLLSGRWPLPSGATVVDPLNPGRITPRTEAERRQEYLDQIGRDHPLMGLILECLSNNPRHRPNAEAILDHVRDATTQHPPPFDDKIAQMRGEEELRERQQQDMEHLQQHFEQSEITHSFQMQQKQRQTTQFRGENERMKELLESRDREIRRATSTIAAKDQEIGAAENVIQAKTEQIQNLSATIEERDLELALKQSDVETKENEIVQLKTENMQAMQYLSSGSQLHPLHTNAQLKWTRGANLPVAMTAPQYTLIGSDLYMGGGQTEEDDNQERCKVFKYNSRQDVWGTLPTTSHKFFGLGSVHGKPTVVGGQKSEDDQLTGEVLTFEQDRHAWIPSLPPMPTPRARTCVVSHESGIVACGGHNRDGVSVDTVEIFQYDTNQWYTTSPLLAPQAGLRCAQIGNTTYFIGGHSPSMAPDSGKVDCIHGNLFSDTTRQENGNILVKWGTIEDVPLSKSCPVNLCGSLLALGGDGQPSGVHLFEPNTDTWLHIGDLPEARNSSAAATLPNGQVILVAGRNNAGKRKSSTFIGRIQRK